MARYKIDPYLFSENEKRIMLALKGKTSPSLISKETNIPRATVYFALEKLKTRGLVKSEWVGKKRLWSKTKGEENIQDYLINSSLQDGNIRIYKTKEELERFLNIITDQNISRFMAYSGNAITEGWNANVGKKEIVRFNNLIRENTVVRDLISSKPPIQDQINKWGDNWSNSFGESPTEYHIINEKYVNHGAQIFFRNQKVSIINMNKPIVIEIDDQEIYKMFDQLFNFVKDKTEKVNVTTLLNK